MMLLRCFLGGFALLFLACTSPTAPAAAPPAAAPSPEFQRYWYAGQAELSRYRLTQSRYGALHPGEAVLVFVTEDFLPRQQVKFEGGKTGEQPVSVLKMNQLRRFATGIYDYSLNTSVFTPVSGTGTLKVVTTVQDWCGQTFSQLNRRGKQYHLETRSYFQQEADQDQDLPADALLEDELWTRLRLAPTSLPTGAIRLIPGTVASRLRHRPLRPEPATATLAPYTGQDFQPSQPGAALQAYSVRYAAGSRTLTIVFEAAFPHLVAGWDDSYDSQMQLGGQTVGSREVLTTRAVRTHTLRSDYWQRHTPADSTLRRQLGVTGFGK
ncbi:hypothetical protein LJ737_16725 [Hymenobacter sp. 15J16-1T3B]|uniref:hypothetical protein n=1 Tax=Hymenobacter sp. 15J16-1T3B TaxID=2886941 RepID=UPI001D12B02C|nr:hypothetical protein [Hymenobacter sp. 15J16-1T3B]MCC3158889.1 hypothetical protein [Hymenobacter sp. 15J16-1T3B]